MKRIVLAVAVAMAGCDVEDPNSAFPDPGGLYSIEEAGPVVPGGAVWWTEPAVEPYLAETFARECFQYEGRDVQRVDLTFRRDSDVAPWRHTFTNWAMGACP
jgi:hypothetical protein